MKTLKYKIKPTIYLEDKKLWIFNNEILDMPFSMIEDGITSCKRVMSGEYPEMSWGLEVSELLIHKEISTLEYHGKFVAEIPTEEICEMLEKYRDKLKEYENEA
ncbi:hypothetical protein [Flavobacterium anhuiense]|uniref:hypothetical protein n=1 Tax=Flavobacterium anhuiense TaxID=459526 RepID=UPI003D957FC6